jgi:DnaJ-class molecular chaperone
MTKERRPMSDPHETLIERRICPDCMGTGFKNHYLSGPSDQECPTCRGEGEIYVDTNLIQERDELS